MAKNGHQPDQRTAIAYFRTSSTTNAGPNKKLLRRQRRAVRSYAKIHKLKIVQELYDPAVSGADPIQDRPRFAGLLAHITRNGARFILVENASRFARDLAVQIAGHHLLKDRGIVLVVLTS